MRPRPTSEGGLWVPTRLVHTPLMVSADEARAIAAALNGEARVAAFFPDGDRASEPPPAGIAVIPVLGGLAHRGWGWFWEASYGDIRRAFREAMADDAVAAVVFDIDSPGGEVAGVFDLADEIFAARGAKPIYAVANEDAFSAAYAIASAADRVFLSRTAGVGSVGVIAVHADRSGYDEKLGVKYTAVFAGARKNDFSPHGPLSDAARAVAQAGVDRAYALFVSTVARNRRMDPAAVRETEAAIFEGADAVDIGFADAVMPWGEALAAVAADIRKKGGSIMDLASQLKALIEGAKPDEAAAALAPLGFAPRDEAAETARLEAAGKQAAQAERARAGEIAGLCELGGMPQLAAGLIAEGADAATARTRIVEARAAAGGEEIASTLSGLNAGGKNPLLADAEKRAKAAG